MNKQVEYLEQCALFAWAAMQESMYPDLALLVASANGGKRDIVTATKLKRSGVKAGYPDTFLPVTRGDKAGLFIEMKTRGNKPTELQLWWHQKLREQGYVVWVCYSWEDAKDVILAYLNMKIETI